RPGYRGGVSPQQRAKAQPGRLVASEADDDHLRRMADERFAAKVHVAAAEARREQRAVEIELAAVFGDRPRRLVELQAQHAERLITAKGHFAPRHAVGAQPAADELFFR